MRCAHVSRGTGGVDCDAVVKLLPIGCHSWSVGGLEELSKALIINCQRGDDAGRARAAGVARVLRPRPLAHNAVGERPRLRDGRRRRDHVVAMVAEPTSVSTAGRGGGHRTTRRNRGAFLIPTRSYSSYNSNHTRQAPYKGSASATSSAAFFPAMICVSMHETGDSMFA